MDEETLRKYRQQIDEKKEWITKYGWSPAMMHVLRNVKKDSEEYMIWTMALVESSQK